jgi:hypothetical protein
MPSTLQKHCLNDPYQSSFGLCALSFSRSMTPQHERLAIVRPRIQRQCSRVCWRAPRCSRAFIAHSTFGTFALLLDFTHRLNVLTLCRKRRLGKCVDRVPSLSHFRLLSPKSITSGLYRRRNQAQIFEKKKTPLSPVSTICHRGGAAQKQSSRLVTHTYISDCERREENFSPVTQPRRL